MEQALILGLAAWRLAHLFIYENGPFDIFERFRQFIGIKPGPIEGFLPQLFSCVYCLTIWFVPLVYFIQLIEPIVVIIMTAMAVALIAHRIMKGGD